MPSNEPRAMITGISAEIRTRGSAPVQGIVLEKFKAHTSSESTLISHNQPPHPTNTTCHPFSITATKTNHAKSFMFDDHQRSRHPVMRGSIQPHITTQPRGPFPLSPLLHPPPLRGRLLGGFLAVSYTLRFTASLRSRSSRSLRSCCSYSYSSRSRSSCRLLRAN